VTAGTKPLCRIQRGGRCALMLRIYVDTYVLPALCLCLPNPVRTASSQESPTYITSCGRLRSFTLLPPRRRRPRQEIESERQLQTPRNAAYDAARYTGCCITLPLTRRARSDLVSWPKNNPVISSPQRRTRCGARETENSETKCQHAPTTTAMPRWRGRGYWTR